IKRSDYTALGELIRITESIMTANDSEVMGDIVNAQVMADDVFPAKTGKSFHELVNVTPTPKSLKERATEAGKKIVDSIQSGVFDRYHALRELDQAMGLDPLQKPELSTWVQARLVGASHGAFKVMMQYGKVAWDQSGVTLDAVKRKAGDKEGFLGELAVLGSEAEIKRFMAWIAANRANNLKDKQSYEERLFTDEQIAEGMAYNQGMMEDGKGRAAVYAKVYKAFNEYHSSVLDIASQSGIISEDARTAWENDFYVPFYRVMDEDKDATFSGILNDGLTKANVIKEIKGSKREIGDLLTNYLVNAQRLIDASMKNAAARKAMEQAMEAGIVSEAGEKSNPTSTTWVMENGQKVKYEFDFTKSVAGQNAHQKEIEVEARAVFEAINALNPIGLNSASLNVMRSFKRVFTNLTTASPAFQVRNLIRDSIQTAATEKGGGKFVKGGKLYGMGGQINHFKARMLASGGAFAFGNNFGDSTQDIMANINGELQAVPVLGLNNVKRSMQQWWRRYSEFSDSVENMNRAAVFDENLGDGLAAAAFRSRDLLDFSAHGAYSGTRILISVVPFLNARLQGLHKLGRHASDKHKRARLTAVMGALAVGSLLLHLRNHDDEDYQKLQDWQRDGYWFMKLGDKALFIPKPFELGAMATMTERAMDMATSGFSPEQSAEFRDALLRTLVSTFQLNPTPQMIKPSLEVWANYDTFRGRSIENYADQNVPAYMGYNENSTGFSKLASKAGYGVMNAIGLEDSALSPKQIDHMVRGYLGWFGVTVTGLPDLIAESTSDAPTKHWWERSLVRWAYRDLNAPVYTKQQEQFYEMLSDFKQHHTAYRQLINSGQSEEAKSYYVEHRDEINRSKQFDKMQRYLSKLNKQERMIYNNPKLSSDEKRWALDNIKRKKAEVAEYLVRQNPQ
uniref:LPD38 domain-containing protein n=1 Tax=Photobacterium halotolerans TaxID=265726 RepID=UPI000486B828